MHRDYDELLGDAEELPAWPHYRIVQLPDGRWLGGARQGKVIHYTAYCCTEQDCFQQLLECAPVMTRHGQLPRCIADSIEEIDRRREEIAIHPITVQLAKEDLKLIADLLHDECERLRQLGEAPDRTREKIRDGLIGWTEALWLELAELSGDFVRYKGWKRPPARYRGLPDDEIQD